MLHPDLFKTNKVVRVRIFADGAKYSINDNFVAMTLCILTGRNDLSSSSKSYSYSEAEFIALCIPICIQTIALIRATEIMKYLKYLKIVSDLLTIMLVTC